MSSLRLASRTSSVVYLRRLPSLPVAQGFSRGHERILRRPRRSPYDGKSARRTDRSSARAHRAEARIGKPWLRSGKSPLYRECVVVRAVEIEPGSAVKVRCGWILLDARLGFSISRLMRSCPRQTSSEGAADSLGPSYPIAQGSTRHQHDRLLTHRRSRRRRAANHVDVQPTNR